MVELLILTALTEVTGTGVVVLTGTSTSVFHLDGLTDLMEL